MLFHFSFVDLVFLMLNLYRSFCNMCCFLETDYQLHAQQIVGSLDIKKFDGIICVSGDGVLVEVSIF